MFHLISSGRGARDYCTVMWFFSITVRHRTTSFRIWAENSFGELVLTVRLPFCGDPRSSGFAKAFARAAFADCTMEGNGRGDRMQAMPTIELFTMAPIGWALI